MCKSEDIADCCTKKAAADPIYELLLDVAVRAAVVADSGENNGDEVAVAAEDKHTLGQLHHCKLAVRKRQRRGGARTDLADERPPLRELLCFLVVHAVDSAVDDCGGHR